MKPTLVAALIILFADWAYCQEFAAVHEVREPITNCPEVVNHEVRTNVVQVHVHGGLGSGIYLGDRIVLTAAHVVSGHRRARVNFPNPANPKGPFHESVVGTILATDRTWDQAVIELDLFPKHNPPGSPLAADNPKTGDKVTFAGYPGGRSLKMMRGQFERYSSAMGQRTADWFDSDAGVISGYSGGAAYSDDGALYGNLWGSTGSSTVAVCLGRTKRFLLPWNARLEAWRLAIKSGNAGTMQWGNCPPGGCPPGYGGGGPRYIEPGDGDDAPSAPPGGGGGSLTPVPPPVQPPTVPVTPPVDLSGIESAIAKINARIDGLVAAKPDAGPSPYALSEDDVTTIVGQLLVSMEGNPAFRGPPGENGKDGQPGQNGSDGKPATAAKLTSEEYSRIALEVRKRLAGELRVRVEPVPRKPAK